MEVCGRRGAARQAQSRRGCGRLGVVIPYRHVEQCILDAAVAAGYPITLAQARLFQRVDHRGSRLTQLAASAQVTKQAAGFLVDQLDEGGYVERVRDPRDGRARLVRIPPRGYDVTPSPLPNRRRSRPSGPATWARGPPPTCDRP
jgi:DNA-binding MarR family transcriptional regulator